MHLRTVENFGSQFLKIAAPPLAADHKIRRFTRYRSGDAVFERVIGAVRITRNVARVDTWAWQEAAAAARRAAAGLAAQFAAWAVEALGAAAGLDAQFAAWAVEALRAAAGLDVQFAAWAVEALRAAAVASVMRERRV
jgi:hypothetical protein